jgi:hypothetical protein
MKRPRWRKAGIRLVLAVALLAAALVALDIGLDEPLRRRMERMMNQRLQGYSVSITKLDLHLWGGSLDLHGLLVSQNAYPEPPVADFERLTASVQWKSLLRGRIVADVELEHPVLRVDLRQLSEESADEVPVEERGWQHAVNAIYPFKINELRVHGGEVVYVDQDPERPLVLHDVAFRAENIRNVVSPERTYPSEVALQATVFDAGALSLQGQADFLSEPHMGLRAHVDIREVELSFISPVLERFGLIAHHGTLGVRGDLEYGPSVQNVLVDELVIAGTRLDYLYRTAEAPEQEEAAEEIVEAAGDVQNDPVLLTRVHVLRIEDSRLTIANPGARPPYSLWWDGIDMVAENISNQADDGPAVARLTARFMGTGPTQAQASFLPASKSPDFGLSVGIQDTDMRTLNDLFRAHGNFDVVAGLFSFYSELRVSEGRIEGYVKPLFRDIRVYHPAQDRSKGFWRRTWERLVGVAAKVLKNERRQEVATRVDISGDVENPRASTLQIVLNLARNAFVEAILPGLERETGVKAKDRRKDRKGGDGDGDDRRRRKDRKADRKAASGIIPEKSSEAMSLHIL